MTPDILENISTGRAYTTKMIVVSSFFGGFYIGGFMMYQNFKKFGEHKKAAATVVITVVALTALVATAMLPAMDRVPGVVYSLFLTLGISLLSNRFQGDLIQQHVSNGGKLHSSGRACWYALRVPLSW